MQRQIARLLEIVQRGEAKEIEAARNLVRPEMLPDLLAAYWHLADWDEKAGLMQLFSDHLTSAGRDVMLDFLAAPTSDLNDEYYTSGKIVALCQLAGTFALYERCWTNRPLFQAVVQRALASERPSVAMLDALETPTATPGPQRQKRRALFEWLGQHPVVFLVLNTVFWVGLAVLLLSDPLRTAIGAALLALAGGIYMLYAGLLPRVTRGMAQPTNTRIIYTVFGLALTAFALAILVHVLNGGVSSRRQTQQRTTEARIVLASEGGERLDLSGMGLREVPTPVWELEHLIELDLSDNRLTSLPPEIGNLTNLERLELDGNRLESLPTEIGRLVRLERLDLDNNRLTTLPAELANLQQLSHLHIQYNRWTAFPEAILALPNLELLWIKGNPMGELPQAITRRAEAGELSLVYEPNATPVDWASVAVIISTFVLPVLASWGVGAWWARWERAQRQTAQQQGTVLAIPPFLRTPMLFVVFGLLAISLFVFVVAIAGALPMEAGIGIPLMFVPLAIGGAIFLLRHTGFVLLGAEGVSLRRTGRARFVRYSDIVELRLRTNPFAPALLIRGREETLGIPRTLTNLPQFYEWLLARVPPAVRDATLGKPVTPRADGGPVYALAVSWRVWALYIAGTVLLALFYLGFGLMGLWMELAQGNAPPFRTESLQSIAIWFLVLSVVFIPALIVVIRALLTRYGPFQIEQPIAWEFYPERIRYRLPRGSWQEKPAHDLQRARLQALPFKVRGARGVQQKMTSYALVLEFAGGEQLVVEQERAVQFGESVERLHAIIQDLYGKG